MPHFICQTICSTVHAQIKPQGNKKMRPRCQRRCRCRCCCCCSHYWRCQYLYNAPKLLVAQTPHTHTPTHMHHAQQAKVFLGRRFVMCVFFSSIYSLVFFLTVVVVAVVIVLLLLLLLSNCRIDKLND